MSQGYCMGNIRKGKDREFVIPFDIQEEFKKDKLEFQRKKKNQTTGGKLMGGHEKMKEFSKAEQESKRAFKLTHERMIAALIDEVLEYVLGDISEAITAGRKKKIVDELTARTSHLIDGHWVRGLQVAIKANTKKDIAVTEFHLARIKKIIRSVDMGNVTIFDDEVRLPWQELNRCIDDADHALNFTRHNNQPSLRLQQEVFEDKIFDKEGLYEYNEVTREADYEYKQKLLDGVTMTKQQREDYTTVDAVLPHVDLTEV